MLRRFLVILIRRSLLILLLVCLGCVAQSAPPDVARKIEHQGRAFYTIPPEVKVTVGAITPRTDWPGYDAVSVNIDRGEVRVQQFCRLRIPFLPADAPDPVPRDLQGVWRPGHLHL